jgi:hypothetical protein
MNEAYAAAQEAANATQRAMRAMEKMAETHKLGRDAVLACKPYNHAGVAYCHLTEMADTMAEVMARLQLAEKE